MLWLLLQLKKITTKWCTTPSFTYNHKNIFVFRVIFSGGLRLHDSRGRVPSAASPPADPPLLNRSGGPRLFPTALPLPRTLPSAHRRPRLLSDSCCGSQFHFPKPCSAHLQSCPLLSPAPSPPDSRKSLNASTRGLIRPC